jgi:hypothetical protein
MFRTAYPIILLVLVSACGGMGSTSPTSSSSSSSTTAPAPSIPNPGVLVSQTGCSATFACPSTDIAGMPNPSTPTLDNLTISNGTSATCRVGYTRATSGGTGTTDPIAVGITVRNPAPGCQFHWGSEARSDNMTSFLFLTPSIGCTLPGSFQATASFSGTPPGVGSQEPSFISVLTVDIFDTSNTMRASCGIPVYGILKS